MEQRTRRFVKLILWYFAIFVVLISIIIYFPISLKQEEIVEKFINLLPKILGILLVIVITKLILSALRPAFEKGFERTTRSFAEVKMKWQLLSNITWIFVIIVLALVIIEIDIGSLIVFGVVVAALLYVLQRPILNIAGWVDIILHRPYSIGDRIEIDKKKGYVVDVGMFHTTLREFGEWMGGDTFTGRLITIPNSNIFETPILNYTRDTPYIWDEIKIAITYESDHDRAKLHILESALEVVGDNMIKYAPYMAQRMDVKDLRGQIINEPQIRLEFSESSVNFYVIYFCEAQKRRAIRSKITENILGKIKKDKKIHIAYPHMEVVGVKKN
ncbi:MAG: mechanosensitive ion channel [Thermoplasmata archaeon]|nr:MAG: mechanosensitive ion channel [Thermoplasmata archaeon]